MIKSLGFDRGSDDTYDLSELINKYRSGASISELSNISLEKKTNSKKQILYLVILMVYIF